MKSKVYFTKEITPEKVVEMYKVLGKELPGKVAVKLHSGEEGNKNYLRPEFCKPIIDYVKGTVVECNTAYSGARNTTEKHLELIKKHQWDEYFDFDLLDAEGPDVVLPVNEPLRIKENYVGKNIEKYDSMLVLSHFKGHAMGGYGGAIKQLSIGCASSNGKAYIHTSGKCKDQKLLWLNLPKQDYFLEAMSDAASSVVDYFKGNIVYINVMKNISVDCDCDGHAKAPCMKDMGILVSLDPVAIDQACIDLVTNSDDPGKKDLLKRIDSKHGTHTIDVSDNRFGSKEYELIEIA